MKEEQIEALLKRYMEAETTPDEENRLRRYFERGDYPARFAAYAEMMGVVAQNYPALSDAECEELLHLCPPPARHRMRVWPVVRYAAVWLLGLLLGGGVVWLSRPAEDALPSAALTAQVAPARVDTLVRERVIVQSDTIYQVKYKYLREPRHTEADVQHPAADISRHTAGNTPSAQRTSRSVSAEVPAEEHPLEHSVPWDNLGNLAALAER